MSQPRQLVDARIPLALLHAVQQQDTPAQLLPDEHPHFFFPNRLGLSSVIEDQARQFRRLARLRRHVDQERVEALFELISRRPDAGAVLTAAGRELADLHFAGLRGAHRRIGRHLPGALRRRAALRALRRARRAFLIAADSSIGSDPIEIRAVDAMTARVGSYSDACRLYGSLAERLLELSGLDPSRIVHPECQRRGSERCVWRVEDRS